MKVTVGVSGIAVGVFCVFASGVVPTARADVRQAAPDGFLIEHRYSVAASPARVWDDLLHPERWWPSDHTWSGDRANLSLGADAGSCFCERWPDGSAEHGRVAMSRPLRLLRMAAPLGPLQAMAVSAVLTIELSPEATGTIATVTLRVSGDAAHRLDELAPTVDGVLGMQFGNLARHAGGEDVDRAPAR
jgi:uncharacterized protein YndB with AHSA1/START domain